MTLTQISKNIYKSNNDSNIYIIKDLNLAIDAGNAQFYNQFKQQLESIHDLKKIKTVILTHLHYDHIGCYRLFPNAKFYCNDDIIKDFKKRKNDYILDANFAEEFNIKLHSIKELELPKEYKIIKTPGHCASCICIYNSKEYILYSGDTLFFNGMIGRYDLPTSNYSDLKESLLKLDKCIIKILCPGHDY